MLTPCPLPSSGPNGRDWRTENPGKVQSSFPCRIPPAFASLIAAAENSGDAGAADALKRQVCPSPGEGLITGNERSDPLGEASHCVFPRLVHQYKNRVLLLSTGRCIGYCRYCFRRSFGAGNYGFISDEETEQVCGYIAGNPEIDEILVSGGDPMSAPFRKLEALFSKIRGARPSLLIRLCTRAPVFAPEIFTPKKLKTLKSFRPLWIIPHINHPEELGSAQRKCLSAFIDAGIPVQSQTVLLQGVNDDSGILCRLFKDLTCLGVKPGYLFQCDLAPGTSCFRVPLKKGLSIWKELRKELSGLSLPSFAVDLPGGGGKFPLSVAALVENIVSCTNNELIIRCDDGKVYTYLI